MLTSYHSGISASIPLPISFMELKCVCIIIISFTYEKAFSIKNRHFPKSSGIDSYHMTFQRP